MRCDNLLCEGSTQRGGNVYYFGLRDRRRKMRKEQGAGFVWREECQKLRHALW
jgi:hypothetical protein